MIEQRLLFLGGGGRQLLPLIQSAKTEGCYVILVGNIKVNPGIDICDKHYDVDCTDLGKVIEIARNENIDGVLGNAEYAMKYVCELMNMGCKQKDVDKLINLLMGILVTAQDAIADDTWQEYYIAVSLDSEEKQ